MLKRQCHHVRLFCLLGPWLLAVDASADIIYQAQKLLPSDGAEFEGFGAHLAANGDLAVVGSPYDDASGPLSGSAYVFRRIGASWVAEQKLQPLDGAENKGFGVAAAVEGNVVVVGASGDDRNGFSTGAAYVFRWNGMAWAQEQKLIALDGTSDDSFGYSVAISEHAILVGARSDDVHALNSGSAYIFRHNGTSWVQEQKLLPPSGSSFDSIGTSVSLAGNVAVLGGLKFPSSPGIPVYVFRWNGSSWALEQQLVPTGGVHNHAFGRSVSVSGNIILVGSVSDSEHGPNAGAAYAFGWNGLSWVQQQKLVPIDTHSQLYFGHHVAVVDDVAVIGAPYYLNGATYVFHRHGEVWVEHHKLLASDGSDGDALGNAVGLAGRTVWAGSPNDADQGVNSGSAYVFDLPDKPIAVPTISEWGLILLSVLGMGAGWRVFSRK